MSHRLLSLGLALACAACVEDLTTPGVCPEYCPPGQISAVDSVLRDEVSGDSAFRGYVQPYDATVIPATFLPGELDSRPVLRTTALPSRVRLGVDTATGAVVGVDSLRLQLVLLTRDTSVRDLMLVLHRIPRTVDSATTYADLAPDFAAPAIRVIHVDSLIALAGQRDTITGDSVAVDTSGVVTLLLSLDSADVGWTEADSGRIGLAIGARSDTLAGSGAASARIGAGDRGLVMTWFARVDSLGADTVARGIGGGAEFDSYVFDRPVPALDSTLAVGGAPSARSLLRFARPSALFDSTQIVRATLVLVPEVAALGTPADSFQVIAQRVVTDLGAKSPLAGPAFIGDQSYFGASVVHPGALDTVRIDVTDLVRRWQNDTLAPTALMLRADPEGGGVGEVRFAPSRTAALRPALHVTYIPRFPFGEP